MKYKLLCLDIDGTLLDDDKKISKRTAESIRKAAAEGIKIVLSSGRMPAGVDCIEKELGVECIKICNAGTYILAQGKCIRSERLSVETMLDIHRDFAIKWEIPLWIFQDKEWYVTGWDKFVDRETGIVPYRPEVVDAEALASRWKREATRPNKLLLAADPEQISVIYEEMKGRKARKERSYQEIGMACSADTFIEIFPWGVDKGKALLAVCERLGISPENTIAIGDQELDIPMIETAGMGIAMGNAIAGLKEKADFVTGTNNEDGIASALEEFVLTPKFAGCW